jgi:cell division protein FtsZ
MEEEKKLKFELEEMVTEDTVDTLIKVIGVGGCGCNIVSSMSEMGLTGAELIAVNTDKQSLANVAMENKVQIGRASTMGRGAGQDPKKGEAAAEEDRSLIETKLSGTQMVFVMAGLGGGTGSGAAPVITDVARNMGILTIAVVITPFEHELNEEKRLIVENGIERLKNKADALITISNQKIMEIYESSKVLQEAYKEINRFLIKRVDGLIRMITIPGIQNIDFADVVATIKKKGNSFIGIGRGSGTDRAKKAFDEAINNPILNDVDMKGAKGILVNFTGQITIHDMSEIANIKKKYTGENVSVKFGMVHDESMTDEIEVVILISGIRDEGEYYADEEKDARILKMDKMAIENGYDTDAIEIPAYQRIRKSQQKFFRNEQPRVEN